jgi:dihydrofolate reductase
MRKVVVGAFVTLDGVVQAPGGLEEDRTGGFHHGGWVQPLWDGDCDEKISSLFSEPFDLLLGRKTYEIFAAYWPYAQDDIGRSFNAATKYVATRSGTPLTWRDSVAIGDAVVDVQRLKHEDGPVLLTQGSSVLVRSLLAADLVDELHLLTFPITLGRGKRLFADDASAGAFQLFSHKVSGTGVVIASYRRSGDVRTGSFVLEAPTEAELQRRERWKHAEG